MNLSELYMKNRPSIVYPKFFGVSNALMFELNALHKKPENLMIGTVTYDTNTGNMYVYNGSNWLQIASQLELEEVSPWRI